MRTFIFQLFLLLSGNAHDVEVIPAFGSNDPGVAGAEIEMYSQINWGRNKPDFRVFYSAVRGYRLLQDSLHLFDKPILTIIDFSKASSSERLWVVNLDTRQLIINSLVAHGRNSGDVIPERFSNQLNSFQSSLGFYKTGSSYSGKHGLSLKLHGLEKEINDQAERRSIVVHGADYVSEKYISRNGRLGRSQGCPAVSMAIHSQLIKAIQHNTCLFVFYPEKDYLKTSVVLNSRGQGQQLAHHSNNKHGKL